MWEFNKQTKNIFNINLAIAYIHHNVWNVCGLFSKGMVWYNQGMTSKVFHSVQLFSLVCMTITGFYVEHFMGVHENMTKENARICKMHILYVVQWSMMQRALIQIIIKKINTN